MSVKDDFLKLARELVERKLSYVWLGYADVLFLEFDSLRQRIGEDGKIGNHPSGGITISLNWDWVFTDSEGLVMTFEDDTKKWSPVLKSLVGGRLSHLGLVSPLNELEMVFMDGRRLTTISGEEADSTYTTWYIIDRRSEGSKGFSCEGGVLRY